MVRAVVAVCACVLGVGTAPAASADTGGQAVTYQLDPAHDGFQPAPGFTLPLRQQWTVEEPYYVGNYPLIANGVLYALVGQRLTAIDLSSGATLWQDPPIVTNIAIPGLAYGGGRIYVITGATAYDQVNAGQSAGTGEMTAFDAATGAVDWTAGLPGEYEFDTAPSVGNGDVYVTGVGWGTRVYALSQSDGHLVWSQAVEGSDTSPAVTSDGVYTGFVCGWADDFAPATGTVLWQTDAGCVGGGWADSVIGDGNFYDLAPENAALILSPDSGASLGSFGGPLSDYPTSAAVGDGMLYTVNAGTLRATADDGLGAVAWTFGEHLATAPLVAGSFVFEDDPSGQVYALDASTGSVLWSTTFPHDLAGGVLTVADQHLITVSGGAITAYSGAPLASGGPTGSGAGGPTGSGSAGSTGSGSAGSTGSGSAGSTGSVVGVIPAGAGSALTQTQDSGAGSATTSQSQASGAAPQDRVPPRLPARMRPRHRATARTGTWYPAATRYAFQWLVCDRRGGRCHVIPGATGRSFTPRLRQVGHRVRVRIRARDASGVSPPATSRAALVVGLGPRAPSIHRLRLRTGPLMPLRRAGSASAVGTCAGVRRMRTPCGHSPAPTTRPAQ